eukprot:CAMPEP_0177418322 /NCGR_PEP_ID=MMETSP0368-20130122/69120_1 /TAXON_ID=447022 ORGANISM="Scrippsiella hangoei-like, Strain SHHI-4" /NCGR_SAMPLE_ID=MMETSP0368 /ASSEMBLY_ACC=CAM_ASM_000363 /LENGTH=338 /DNA_ID=CAMNT_0018887959 /DNA_START=56 /DNA_END=1073 /DNA_ORIENTATION=-
MSAGVLGFDVAVVELVYLDPKAPKYVSSNLFEKEKPRSTLSADAPEFCADWLQNQWGSSGHTLEYSTPWGNNAAVLGARWGLPDPMFGFAGHGGALGGMSPSIWGGFPTPDSVDGFMQPMADHAQSSSSSGSDVDAPPGLFLPKQLAQEVGIDTHSEHSAEHDLPAKESMALLPDERGQGCWAEWVVRGQRLKSMDKQAVSPVFKITFPGQRGPTSFKIMICPAARNDGRGGGSFKQGKGKGRVGLKCTEELEEGAQAMLKYWVVIGEGPLAQPMRGPLTHNFAEQSCSEIGAQDAWNFAAAVDTRDTFVVRFLFEQAESAQVDVAAHSFGNGATDAS